MISQVYPPDSAAVGQHLADVAESLAAQGHRVTVLTANRGYDDPSSRFPLREMRNGVAVRRLPLSSFGKRNVFRRLCAHALFMIQAVTHALLMRGVTRILVSTSPPFAGPGGALIAHIRRVPLIWWIMDLNPDQLVVTRAIAGNSLPARTLDALNRFTARRADAVIALDDYMKQRLASKYPIQNKVSVIPPWSHGSATTTDPAALADFRARHGLDDCFVVMYSGNHALQHPLDTALAATHLLRDEPNLKFVFVGGGIGKAAVERRISCGARNIVTLPYQPLEMITATLAAADLHLVSMGDEMVGIVHPCKIYGVMAVGRPVLYFGHRESPIYAIVHDAQCGWRVAHGDVESACRFIREAIRTQSGELKEMGVRAKAYVMEKHPPAALVQAVCDLILEPTCRTILD
jgi:colanic acid biosynthesis glycosyl transferase WcaI